MCLQYSPIQINSLKTMCFVFVCHRRRGLKAFFFFFSGSWQGKGRNLFGFCYVCKPLRPSFSFPEISVCKEPHLGLILVFWLQPPIVCVSVFCIFKHSLPVRSSSHVVEATRVSSVLGTKQEGKFTLTTRSQRMLVCP